MYCEELDRLLEVHSRLTLEYFRQDVRTQAWYGSAEEWARECQKLEAAEQEMDRVAADVVDHRRRHGCGGADALALSTPRLRSGKAPDTRDAGATQV
jgi:hypothetical protein